MAVFEYGDMPTIAISQQDWPLNHRGKRDDARHSKKVEKMIEDNIQDIINEGDILGIDPATKKPIRIPMRALDLPNIRYGDPKEGVGSGDGTEQEGDVIYSTDGDDEGDRVGQEEGLEFYEVEVKMEDLIRAACKDLGLPYLQPKKHQQIESETPVFDDIRRRKTMSNLDYQKTMIENLMRNAREKGEAVYGDYSYEDFRNRVWRADVKNENNAAMIVMRDTSGSMGAFEVYISRLWCWWEKAFLELKYPKVDIAYLIHTTVAEEVTQSQFFDRADKYGGTLCSSANKLALDLIRNRYPPKTHNVYVTHLTDGDNQSSDNDACVETVQEMLAMGINQYGYVQVARSNPSSLMVDYDQRIKNPRFESGLIVDKTGVWPLLRKFYDPDKVLN